MDGDPETIDAHDAGPRTTWRGNLLASFASRDQFRVEMGHATDRQHPLLIGGCLSIGMLLTGRLSIDIVDRCRSVVDRSRVGSGEDDGDCISGHPCGRSSG